MRARVSAMDKLRRQTSKMEPVEWPPLYAMPIWLCRLNTEGGPKRDARAEMGEALVTGRIAAHSACEARQRAAAASR
jgi:hypothetical protein